MLDEMGGDADAGAEREGEDRDDDAVEEEVDEDGVAADEDRVGGRGAEVQVAGAAAGYAGEVGDGCRHGGEGVLRSRLSFNA